MKPSMRPSQRLLCGYLRVIQVYSCMDVFIMNLYFWYVRYTDTSMHIYVSYTNAIYLFLYPKRFWKGILTLDYAYTVCIGTYFNSLRVVLTHDGVLDFTALRAPPAAKTTIICNQTSRGMLDMALLLLQARSRKLNSTLPSFSIGVSYLEWILHCSELQGRRRLTCDFPKHSLPYTLPPCWFCTSRHSEMTSFQGIIIHFVSLWQTWTASRGRLKRTSFDSTISPASWCSQSEAWLRVCNWCILNYITFCFGCNQVYQ